jgi:hypothetical protein
MSFDPRKKPFVVRESQTRTMLRFLSAVDFSTASILQEAIGVKEKSNMSKKIKSWLREDLISKVEVERPFGGPKLKVYKLSINGQGRALLLNANPLEEISIPKSRLEHSFLCQKAIISLKQMGFFDFCPDGRIPDAKKRFGHVPDYTCRDDKGRKAAIEVERTLKSRARYKQIAKNWGKALVKGEVERIIYVCDSKSTVDGVYTLLGKEIYSYLNLNAKNRDLVENFDLCFEVEELESLNGELSVSPKIFEASTGQIIHAWPIGNRGIKKLFAVESIDENELPWDYDGGDKELTTQISQFYGVVDPLVMEYWGQENEWGF